jgi:ABC-type uncharacterized transport system permease subunit
MSPLLLAGLSFLVVAVLVVIVLLTPVTFRLLHDVYRGVFNGLEAQPQVLALIRFGLSLAAAGLALAKTLRLRSSAPLSRGLPW